MTTAGLVAKEFEKSGEKSVNFRPKSGYRAVLNGRPIGSLPLPEKLRLESHSLGLVEIQSEDVELYHGEDNVFVKQIQLPYMGNMVPGHGHKFSHLSMLSSGVVAMYAKDPEEDQYSLVGEFQAPCGIEVPAHKHHLFIALTDSCILYCIHNTHNLEKHEVKEKLVESYHSDVLKKVSLGHEQMEGEI